MKSKSTFLIALFTLMIVSSACNVTSIFIRTIDGSGNIVTESREVRGFDRVNLSGFGEVIIEVGDEESLTISTDDNIIANCCRRKAKHITISLRRIIESM